MPDAILRLTPRQIADIYQHPRDAEGNVISPQPPADVEELGLEEMLAKLRTTAQALHVPPDQVKQAEEVLRAKYGHTR